MISLALAFGLFISITMESTINYEREKVLFEVGADIKLEAPSIAPVDQPSARTPVLEGLDLLPGVEHVARYSQLDIYFEVEYMLHQAPSVAMDSADYIATVDPSDYFFIDGGSELLDELTNNGSVILTQEFAEDNNLFVGDILPVVVRYERGSVGNVDYYTSRFDVVVAGLTKGLPGLQGMDAFIDLNSLSFITDPDLEELSYREGAFIDVVVGSDPHEVASEAMGLYESVNLTCTPTILQDEYDAMNRDTDYGSLVGFLRVEYALSIIIMTIGVGLLVFVTVHDREKELACIMARGSSGGQIRRILMGESVTLMALGLVIGAGVGVLTSYLFNTLSGEELYTIVERKMVFTSVSYSIVLSSIVALVLAALIATSRAGKVKLAEVLRIRGG
jgi:ABC-type antimicrobial peptide transport system permease subunit